jgi:hypothetical protein
MMRGVQDPPPEDPDSLAPDIEERHLSRPEGLARIGERRQASPRKGDYALDIGLHRRPITLRQQRIHVRLGETHELGEKPPLREDLMNQYLADGAAAGVKPELELIIVQLAPERAELVALRGISVRQVL